MTSARRPLDGMLVLDLGQIYNGPYCGLDSEGAVRSLPKPPPKDFVAPAKPALEAEHYSRIP